MPETYGNMVECEHCFNWFHQDCVDYDNIIIVKKFCAVHAIIASLSSYRYYCYCISCVRMNVNAFTGSYLPLYKQTSFRPPIYAWMEWELFHE